MSKKKRKSVNGAPSTTTAVTAAAPIVSDDAVQQVVTWILEGATEHEIRQTVAKDYADQSFEVLFRVALDHIARKATNPAIPIDKWCVEAAKLIYKRQLEIGEYGAALRTVGHIDQLAQRHLKEAQARDQPKPDSPSTQPASEAASPILIDPDHQSRDARLINRAVKNGWVIPEHIRETLPLELAAILTTAKDNKDKIAAARVLVTMQGQNIRAKPPVKRHQHSHKLDTTPITEANFEERRRQLSERVAGIGQDTGGTGAG